jgi:CRP-like cAMP-binding protein
VSISGVPKLYEMLSPPELARVESLATRRKYRDGEIVHERGDEQGAIGVVVSGRIKLVNPRSDGTEIFSGLIHTGQNYGDAGLLYGEPRLHRAVAIGETVIDHIGAAAFAQMLQDPGIVAAFYRVAAFRLSVTLAMLDDMRTLSPDVRLARLIVRMHRASNDSERLEFLQEEFAGMLGISTVTLAKALRRLERLGMVRSGYRHIRITDPARLMHWLREQNPD